MLLCVIHAQTIGHTQGLYHETRASPNGIICCQRGHSCVDTESSHSREIDEGDVTAAYLTRSAVGKVQFAFRC